MRHQHLILTALISTAIPGFSFAADPGTYRPGTPYYSTQAGSADICENQCSGDAACKGWNFVTVNPEAGAGVCEFNSATASPVPSSVSISGDNGARTYSRALSPGGTNTVRVGSPPPVKIPARTAQSQAVRQAATPLPQSVRPGARAIPPGQTQRAATQTRRVVRQPVPQNFQPGSAAYRTPNRSLSVGAPQRRAPQRPQFQHNLDAGTAPQRPQIRRPAQQAPRQRPQQITPHSAPAFGGDPRLQQMLRNQAGQPQPAAPQNAPRPGAAPPQMPNQMPQQLSRQMSPSAPPQMPPQHPVQRPQSLAEAEQSLFGSLHDDVKVPKPITREEAINPDQPIATATAVPVKKVTVENLMGLAGGPVN